MALPFLFANVSTLATPALDTNYAALGALTPIPCDVAGTNSLTLAPLASTPTVAAYSNYMQFTGIAVQTNTSSVSAIVNAVALLPVYKDTSGSPAVLTGGEIVATCAFGLLYDSALNSGNGGFHLMQITGAGGGGGAVPGGANTDVQFNDNGAFGGNSGFTYDITTLLAVQLTNASTVANGGDINLRSGDGGSTSGGGGRIDILGGVGVGAHPGGVVNIQGGNGGDTGSGADVGLAGGFGGATAGNGGAINIVSGDAGGAGDGGVIQITGGLGTAGTGGNITILGGDGDNDDGGNVSLTGGRAGGAGTGGNAGVFAGDGGSGGTGDGGRADLFAGNGSSTSGSGGAVNIQSGNALTLGAGGAITIVGGTAVGGGNDVGGAISITAGNSTGNIPGAGVTINAGAGTGAVSSGGNVSVNAGPMGTATGPGGNVAITAGQGGLAAGGGGNVVITSGLATTTGDGGSISLVVGAGGGGGIQGHIKLGLIQDLATDAAASVSGVPIDGIYRSGSALKIRTGAGSSGVTFITSAASSISWANIPATSASVSTIFTSGASVGDVVTVGTPASVPTGIIFFGWVSSVSTVSLQAYNVTAASITPVAGTYRVAVSRYT